LFSNLVADSDQLFLPVDIFPLQDLVLAYSLTSSVRRTPAKPAIARKGISSGTSSSAVSKSLFKLRRLENFGNR